MAFLFFCPRRQSKNHFKKKEEEEDIVISAFLCSDTGELANNLFRCSTRITDDILGARNHKHLVPTGTF